MHLVHVAVGHLLMKEDNERADDVGHLIVLHRVVPARGGAVGRGRRGLLDVEGLRAFEAEVGQVINGDLLFLVEVHPDNATRSGESATLGTWSNPARVVFTPLKLP